MSSMSLKRNNTTGLMALASVGILLTALAAHPQTVTDTPSSKAQNGQATSSGKTTPMGSAADAPGNAGSNKIGARSSGDSASAQGGKLAKSDANFIRDIAYANISEVATAKLAQGKSQNEQVKAFAQKMIDDHTKAQQELEQLAQSKGVMLPSEPDAKHKAASKALERLSGDRFDTVYIKQAGENDHQKTHKLLTKISQKAKDPDLKAYATKTLEPVDAHLKMVNEMKASKKGARVAAKATDKTTGKSDAEKSAAEKSAEKGK